MRLYCFAGPNGSGKSTLFTKIIENSQINVPFINADDISRLPEFSKINDSDEKNLLAAKYAEKLRHQMIDSRSDFAFETVLSTNRNLDLLKLAKEKGYEIILFYVSTSNPDINVQRVAKRVNEGGHHVPTDKIISRYYKSMNLFSDVLDVADSAYVYDNSNKYELSLVKLNKEVYITMKTLDKQGNFILPYLKKSGTYKFVPFSVVSEFSDLTNMKDIDRRISKVPSIRRN